MSVTEDSDDEIVAVSNPCDAIELIVQPREKDLGGFSVRRLLPHFKHRSVGPWIFFDHMGPARFAPSEGIDVRPHPHINLATVTYVFEGEILHRDSLGVVQAIRPGEINLMVAGSGIVHSERTAADRRAEAHSLHALQLWHALPEELEEIEPAFHHYAANKLPVVEQEGVKTRVMIGKGFGLASPVKTFSETFYAEIELEPGKSIQLPGDIRERAVYLVSGRLVIDGVNIDACQMVIFCPRQEIKIAAVQSSRLVIVGGEPLGKRYMWWNFASSRKERIEQAKADWQEQRFGKVPGETDFIPLPEK